MLKLGLSGSSKSVELGVNGVSPFGRPSLPIAPHDVNNIDIRGGFYRFDKDANSAEWTIDAQVSRYGRLEYEVTGNYEYILNIEGKEIILSSCGSIELGLGQNVLSVKALAKALVPSSLNTVSVTPNPANARFSIEFDLEKDSETRISVIDMTGARLLYWVMA
jgi:hypothetical protein